MNLSHKVNKIVIVLATTAVVSGGSLALPASPAGAVSAPACGSVLVAASSWLGGAGVDVHSNGAQQTTGNNCGTESYAKPAVQNGNAWQCVELAARLYYVKSWGTVRADGGSAAGMYRYGAKYIPEGSPSLEFHANGSGYSPVPGDLIIEGGSTWGHVSVIDSVSGMTINAVEQNASTTGRHSYTITGTTISGGYNSVRGVMHSPKNTATAAGGTTGQPPQVPSASTWSTTNQSSGMISVFAQGPNNSLVNYWVTPGQSWSSTTMAGAGSTYSTPAVTINQSSGMISVFAQGPNNSLVNYWVTPGQSWSSTTMAGAGSTYQRIY